MFARTCRNKDSKCCNAPQSSTSWVCSSLPVTILPSARRDGDYITIYNNYYNY